MVACLDLASLILAAELASAVVPPVAKTVPNQRNRIANKTDRPDGIAAVLAHHPS